MVVCGSGGGGGFHETSGGRDVIRLGPPLSEMLKTQRESTPGLLRAFGETYMATSVALKSVVSGPSAGSQITLRVDNGASERVLDLCPIPSLRGLMSDYRSLDVPQKIATAAMVSRRGISRTTSVMTLCAMCSTTLRALILVCPPVGNTTADTPTLDLVVPIRETTALDIHRAPASPAGSGTAPTQAAAGSSAAAPSTTGSGTAPSKGTAGSSAAGSSAGTPSATTLRELQKLALPTQAEFPDVAHRRGYHNLVEHADAVTNTKHQSRWEGENMKIIPNTFKEAMGLLEAQQ